MNPTPMPPGDEGDPSAHHDSKDKPEAIPPESQPLMDAFEAMRTATEGHDVAGAIQSMGKIMAMVAADAGKHARASDRIRERARACEESGDVAGAEAAWAEVVGLEEKAGEAAFITKARLDKGQFLARTGRDDKALADLEVAVAAARRTPLEILVWIALEQRTWCALRLGQVALALETAEEAVRTTASDPSLSQSHAWARILRAACLVELGEIPRALEDVEATRSVATGNPVALVLPGLLRWMALWWEVTGRIRLHQQDISGACEACETVVGLRRMQFAGSKEAWRHLVSALRQQAQVVRIDGRPAEANAAAAEAARIESEFCV